MNLPLSALNQADQTLHSLAQLIALTGRQLLPTAADDSQSNIGWNTRLNRLEGRLAPVDNQLIRLVIDIETFTLNAVDENDHMQASFSPVGKSPAHAMTWWTSQMKAWGITTIQALNYRLEHPPVGLHTPYQRPSGLTGWATWRTRANTALLNLNTQTGLESDIRVWPHHFDTGIYYAVMDTNGTEESAIWAGYSIADALSNEPYFYISGYRRDQPIDFNDAPNLITGKWLNSPDWKGAMLPLSVIPGPEAIDTFLWESYSWLNKSTTQACLNRLA